MSTTRGRPACCNGRASRSRAGWSDTPCFRTSAVNRRTCCSSRRRSGDGADDIVAPRGTNKPLERWEAMMPSGFDVRELSVPVIVAPMAGGPSTPELAAAGTNAGGLGFVAAGYLSADALADRVVAARELTSGPVGVNLFVPQPSAATPEAIEKYTAALAPDAERYDAKPGNPAFTDDDWAAKVDVLLDLKPEVASFTFGLP